MSQSPVLNVTHDEFRQRASGFLTSTVKRVLVIPEVWLIIASQLSVRPCPPPATIFIPTLPLVGLGAPQLGAAHLDIGWLGGCRRRCLSSCYSSSSSSSPSSSCRFCRFCRCCFLCYSFREKDVKVGLQTREENDTRQLEGDRDEDGPQLEMLLVDHDKAQPCYVHPLGAIVEGRGAKRKRGTALLLLESKRQCKRHIREYITSAPRIPA